MCKTHQKGWSVKHPFTRWSHTRLDGFMASIYDWMWYHEIAEEAVELGEAAELCLEFEHQDSWIRQLKKKGVSSNAKLHWAVIGNLISFYFYLFFWRKKKGGGGGRKFFFYFATWVGHTSKPVIDALQGTCGMTMKAAGLLWTQGGFYCRQRRLAAARGARAEVRSWPITGDSAPWPGKVWRARWCCCPSSFTLSLPSLPPTTLLLFTVQIQCEMSLTLQA